MPSLRRTDLQRVRERLARQSGPRYWRSLEELAGNDAFCRLLAEEFPRLEKLWDAPASRRQVLKLMAASMALAGLTACDSQPREYLVPYVNMPEHLILGRPRQYASTALVGGYAHGVLVESHEGRPTKLEGNPEHPATLGACDVFAQASVLSLYDPARSSAVMYRDAVAGYGGLLGELQEKQRAWDDSGGAGLCMLTDTITSPSEHARLQTLLRRWPRARWFAHEPVDRDAVYAGTRLLFGEPLDAVYDFTRARVILSLDADFLQAQPGFLRYAHDFAAQRRPRDVEYRLNRLYVAEATPSVTGAVADHRQGVAYPHVEDLARQLARALGLEVPAGAEAPVSDAWLNAVAQDLRRAGAGAVVVPGEQQPPAVHTLAHAINAALGSIGTTVSFIPPVAFSHRARPFSELVGAMHAGEVDSLVVLGANPVYTAPADADFEAAYRELPWRLHWGTHYNETGQLSHWHVPAAHPLETWGDAKAFDDTVSLLQPLIRPLNGGTTALQMLAALTEGVERDARELLLEYWRERRGGPDFETFWRQSLHDGLLPDTAARPRQPSPRTGWASALPKPAAPPGEGVTLQFRPDPAIWDGRYANNGWLQELPRPLTKLTWHNALLISPALAEEHGLAEGDVVRVSTDDRHLELPVYPLPGQPRRAVTLNLGHGRTAAGRVANGSGHSAYALRTGDAPWARPATVTPTGGHQALAVTQQHHAIEGRDLIRAADVARYREAPHFAQRHLPEHSLYPEPWPAAREAEHAWGMVIDLSACIGCNACVTACQAENNIPIVGATEVRRGHEMHWIRVDRYFEGPVDGPSFVFQPVTCMHCENAPCEYVCPVEATQHSASGLNEMIYNRCVGTRYCSQNCPYKVRRFNWFDYAGTDAAYPVEPAVQNPDVTVRSRGVMEKCTYCVQRINTARIAADSEDRPIADGELRTACQQACPTQAIVFGDLADEASHVSALKAHPLNYAMLGELNTRPRTTYLAAVRNPNPALDGEAG